MRIRIFAAFIAGVSVAAAAHAVPTNSAGLRVTDRQGKVLFSAGMSGPGLAQVVGGARDDLGSDGIGNGAASADYGVLKIDGQATVAITTASQAAFLDTLTITSPGIPNGQAGTFAYSLSLDGTLDGSKGVGVTWHLTANAPRGATSQIPIDKQGTDTSGGYLGDFFGRYTGGVTFVYGQPFDIQASLAASAQALGEFDAAFYDLGHSLYWDGISDLRANGAPVEHFDIVSVSGTDYRFSMVPVPEPASALLLLPGLLLLELRRLSIGRCKPSSASSSNSTG